MGLNQQEDRYPLKDRDTSFAFNFKIPSVEQMDTKETQDICSQGNQEASQEETSQDAISLTEPVFQSKSKKKKKKKSGKKQTSEPQQESGSAQVNEGGKNTELVSVRYFTLKLH